MFLTCVLYNIIPPYLLTLACVILWVQFSQFSLVDFPAAAA